MKIVAVNHYYIEENKAGGEMMLHAMLKALVEAGHDVTVVVTETKRKNSEIDGVKVIYDDSALYTLPYDVIISQFHNTLRVFQEARRRNKPMVLVVHNDRKITLTHAAMMRSKDLIVFNTNWIRAKRPETRAKAIVLHPPIDREYFSEVQKKKPEYITLVNLAPEKGPHIFYYLAKNLPEEKFLGVKGGYWKDSQVIENLPNVTIIEQTANMRDDVYAKSKVVLMPSSYESYGMVAAEAMAAGVPVVVSATEGLRENVDFGGIIVEGDKDSWLNTVKEIAGPLHEEASRAAVARAAEQALEAKEELNNFVKSVEGLI